MPQSKSTSGAVRQLTRKERQKLAQKTIKDLIPKLLASDAKARRGVEQAELIVNPQEGAPKVPESNKKNRKGLHLDTGETQNESLVGQNSSIQGKPADLDITIRVADTLLVARHMHAEFGRRASSPNVAILNMASPLRPGGGVLTGASSQEESLCSRTTLLPSLREEWYRLPEYGGIWTPDVSVFRVHLEEQILSKQERFFVDVITAAMLRLPDTIQKDGHHQYANDKDREIVVKKIRAVLRILEMKGTEAIVLGAWGCGAYGNPVREIARACQRALQKGGDSKHRAKPSIGSLRKVVFAIKDPKMAQQFSLESGFPLHSEAERSDISSDIQDNDEEEPSDT
jgi:uncharacterized protein (TIGR02452 family)